MHAIISKVMRNSVQVTFYVYSWQAGIIPLLLQNPKKPGARMCRKWCMHQLLRNQLAGLCLVAKHCIGCGVYCKYPFGEFLNSSKEKRKLQSLLFSENGKFKSHWALQGHRFTPWRKEWFGLSSSPMRRSSKRKEREEMLKLKFLLSHETHDVVHQTALNKTAN